MFKAFESLVHPYPEQTPATPPQDPLRLPVALHRGLRPYILAMTLLTAGIGAFEALLFSMLGSVVDWLGRGAAARRLWQTERGNLLLLGAILLASPLLIALQTLFKHQALAGNFPMLLRWNFHRLMLGQSMQLLPGRVRRPHRDQGDADRAGGARRLDDPGRHPGLRGDLFRHAWWRCVGGFDAWLLLPFLGWLALYVAAMCYFVPRLGRVAKAQADARSLMTGRITDAYTNIATVKLFSHAQREAGFARSGDAGVHGDRARPDAAGHRLRDRQPRC